MSIVFVFFKAPLLKLVIEDNNCDLSGVVDGVEVIAGGGGGPGERIAGGGGGGGGPELRIGGGGGGAGLGVGVVGVSRPPGVDGVVGVGGIDSTSDMFDFLFVLLVDFFRPVFD